MQDVVELDSRVTYLDFTIEIIEFNVDHYSTSCNECCTYDFSK